MRFKYLSSPSRRPLLRGAAAVALCACLSIGVLAPYLREGIYQNGDLWNFLGGVVEARNAIRQGQYPIRVAANQLAGDRYPVFQFYANLPFTVAGAIMGQEGKNPYAAWKWMMFAALMIGGLCTGRLAWRWTRSLPAALSAIAVLLSAPYLLTDLNDRGAVAEAIALCLVPSALLATWTCMVRQGLWRAALCAIAWTAIGLTHNITYLYAATFTAAFIVSFVRPRKRFVTRLGRLLVAGILHGMLLAWYIAPQIAVMGELGISQGLATPRSSHTLVPLDVLLSPICKTPEISTVPRLGLQVGWLVLLGVLGAIAATLSKSSIPAQHSRYSDSDSDSRSKTSTISSSSQRELRRGIALRLLILWAFAFFIAWQPIDFWSYVPKAFYFVQFSYRLLGFTLLFGALLAAFAVKGFRRRRWLAMSVVVAAAALTQFIYYPPGLYHPRGAHRWINDRPQMGGLGDYVVRPREAPAPPPQGTTLMALNTARTQVRHEGPTAFSVGVDVPTRVVLPVLWYPGLLKVDVNGQPKTYGVAGQHVTVDLPAGANRVDVQFIGLTWANKLGLLGILATAIALVCNRIPRLRRFRRR